VKEVVDKMAKKKIGGVVVIEKKVPIGIFTRRDLISVLVSGVNLKETSVESVMHTPVMPVGENDDFIKAARQMGVHDVRRFIAIDGNNKISGMVTDLDVVNAYTLNTLSHAVSMAAVSIEGVKATPNTPLKKVAMMMLEERRSCAVILKNKKPVGIVNEALLAKLSSQFRDPLKFKAEAKMIKTFCGALEGDSLRASVLTMIKRDFRNIILVDEDGRYDGVVSLRELVSFIVGAQL
jgi:CBS domain-containing protein